MAFSGTGHLTTTVNHLQTNGQAEIFNKTMIKLLRHHVAGVSVTYMCGW